MNGAPSCDASSVGHWGEASSVSVFVGRPTMVETVKLFGRSGVTVDPKVELPIKCVAVPN
jgi:hypothetical protein